MRKTTQHATKRRPNGSSRIVAEPGESKLHNARNDFWDSLTSFEPPCYERIRLDKLVAAGISRLVSAGIETSFDNIVVVSHRLFPDKFSLISFPQYPDSIRVDNTLRLDCKHSHYVIGSRPKGFVLTELGKIAAEDALKQIEGGELTRISAELTGERRNRATLLVGEVRNSDAFRRFRSRKRLSRFDVCDVLHGSLDTEESALKHNLDTLQAYAKMLQPIHEYKNG